MVVHPVPLSVGVVSVVVVVPVPDVDVEPLPLVIPWHAVGDALTHETSDDADRLPAADARLELGTVAMASSVPLSKLLICPPACWIASCAWLKVVPARNPM